MGQKIEQPSQLLHDFFGASSTWITNSGPGVVLPVTDCFTGDSLAWSMEGNCPCFCSSEDIALKYDSGELIFFSLKLTSKSYKILIFCKASSLPFLFCSKVLLSNSLILFAFCNCKLTSLNLIAASWIFLTRSSCL